MQKPLPIKRSHAVFAIVALEAIIWLSVVASPSVDATPLADRWAADVAATDDTAAKLVSDMEVSHADAGLRVESEAKLVAAKRFAPSDKTPPSVGCPRSGSSSAPRGSSASLIRRASAAAPAP
jgi:hypothetical protein